MLTVVTRLQTSKGTSKCNSNPHPSEATKANWIFGEVLPCCAASFANVFKLKLLLAIV